MSEPLGTYTFLPWLRQGVANRIGSVVAGARATLDVILRVEATARDGGTTDATVQRSVAMYGPGDIIGIDRAQISRVEPEHWVTNFEPNYFPAIEFYDEDFPWRYTPAVPNDRKLRPWLALVVLEEGEEFAEGGDVTGRPLHYIEVTAAFADVFPDASEGWAWAHAHFNAELTPEVMELNAELAAQKAQQVIDRRPDSACSRLLCLRKLKPKTSYHAFLMPAFESGRLAGLGHDPEPIFEEGANALTPTSSAWGDYGVPANRPDATYFPVYHRWYFRTSERGDFESLVRLLKPRIVDSRVGHRDIDVTDPAPNVSGILDAELGGVLRLGGALRAPLDTLGQQERQDFATFDEWATPYPHQFQTQLATFLNLADSYQEAGPATANTDNTLDAAVQGETDPLITPPIYGRWHALTERLLTERDGTDAPNRENWVHDLNLDPRWRTAAGFGTKVVQQNQEEYMEAAWDQIGDVLEAARRIRRAQLAKAAGRHLHQAHMAQAEQASAGLLIMMASPMKARIVSGGVTVRHQMLGSPLGVTLTSSAMRRTLRPGGRVARRLGLRGALDVGDLVTRANEGAISAAPPKVAPLEILTTDDLADATSPRRPFDRFLARVGAWIRRHRFLALGIALLLIVLLALGLLAGSAPLAVAAVALLALAVWLWRRSGPAAEQQAGSDRLRGDAISPTAVDDMPTSSSFTLVPEVDVQAATVPARAAGGDDSPDAVRFKEALRDQYRMLETSRELGRVPELVPLDLPRLARDVVEGLRPEVTVRRWTLSGLHIPARILEQVGESFVEPMAYPELDMPMYEPLVEAGTDLFVPNLHLVEPDSVTLLETNQKFIEGYMVGLNHEFARELMWREYLTDQRGSYFRQFWDVRKQLAAADDPEEARERLMDIKPLHRWRQANDLGDNDNREVGTEAEEELVLVIRGELLKKYPNTIISAQPAKWQLKSDGTPDKAKERELDESVDPIAPLYEARIAPDIYFFGFDLTALEARGDDTVDDEPGWFFRIEEVPGDARFGFDIEREAGTDINVWNDLSWPDVVPALVDGKPVKVADIPSQTLVEPTGPLVEKHEQWESDQHVPLDANLSSAELAYISLQTPVIMAVHASELLPDQEENGGG